MSEENNKSEYTESNSVAKIYEGFPEGKNTLSAVVAAMDTGQSVFHLEGKVRPEDITQKTKLVIGEQVNEPQA